MCITQLHKSDDVLITLVLKCQVMTNFIRERYAKSQLQEALQMSNKSGFCSTALLFAAVHDPYLRPTFHDAKQAECANCHVMWWIFRSLCVKPMTFSKLSGRPIPLDHQGITPDVPGNPDIMAQEGCVKPVAIINSTIRILMPLLRAKTRQ